jgi:O-antigen/teichoic acid export membrane protein
VETEKIVDALITQIEAVRNPPRIEPKISHAVLLASAQLSRGLARLLFVIVIARALGPERFGVYALLLAMVEMLAVASGSGYIDYLTREAAKDERLGWGLAGQLTWLRAAYAIPFTAAGLGILWLCGYPRLVLIGTACMSLTLIPRSLSEGIQGVLRGTSRQVEFLVVELAFGITLATSAGILLIRGGGLVTAVVTELTAAVIGAVAALGFALKFRTKQRLRLERSQMVKASAIFNIYTFVANLYDRLDVVLLSKLAGDYATGVYSVAYRPIATVQLLPYGVLNSLLPALARGNLAQAEKERLERAMGLLLSMAFAIVLATMVFADALVPLILGTSFAESSAALKILIWAVVLRYLNFALNTRLLAGGHEKVFVVTSLVCLAVNVVGNLVFIPMFSWRAAAVLTIMTELALLAQNVYWVRRAVGSLPRPLGWARLSLVFVVLILALFGGTRIVAPLWIGSACLFFFLFYLYQTGMIGEFAMAWRSQREAGQT